MGHVGKSTWLAFGSFLLAYAGTGVDVSAEVDIGGAQQKFAGLLHAWRLDGDFGKASRGLAELASSEETPGRLRAMAALKLAELAELKGDRRKALDQLLSARRYAQFQPQLRRIVGERMQRLRAESPLADVRGPMPGAAQLKGESDATEKNFAKAERLLETYYRLGVNPRLETVDRELRVKRNALRNAVRAYERVARRGRANAASASYFRIASLYHNLAEVLGFRPPSELLEAEAKRLAARLQKSSKQSLQTAFGYYRRCVQTKGQGPWVELARREVRTLSIVLRIPLVKDGGTP